MNKILSFIKNDTVQLVSAITLVVAIVILMVGGVTKDDFNNIVSLTIEAVAGVAALVVAVKTVLAKLEANKSKKISA
jgi:hypothetical protein